MHYFYIKNKKIYHLSCMCNIHISEICFDKKFLAVGNKWVYRTDSIYTETILVKYQYWKFKFHVGSLTPFEVCIFVQVEIPNIKGNFASWQHGYIEYNKVTSENLIFLT